MAMAALYRRLIPQFVNWQCLYACTFPCSESRMSLSMPAIEATGLSSKVRLKLRQLCARRLHGVAKLREPS